MEKTPKPDFETSQTLQNLARSFAGECQDNIRLKMISKKALDEHLYELSKQLYGIAKHDCIHATLFYHALVDSLSKGASNVSLTAGYPFKKGNLKQNVQHAIDNLNDAGNAVYTAFGAVAHDEGFHAVATLFERIASVKVSDAQTLKTLAEQMSGTVHSDKGQACFCGVCGFGVKGKVKTCPLCKMEFRPTHGLKL